MSRSTQKVAAQRTFAHAVYKQVNMVYGEFSWSTWCRRLGLDPMVQNLAGWRRTLGLFLMRSEGSELMRKVGFAEQSMGFAEQWFPGYWSSMQDREQAIGWWSLMQNGTDTMDDGTWSEMARIAGNKCWTSFLAGMEEQRDFLLGRQQRGLGLLWTRNKLDALQTHLAAFKRGSSAQIEVVEYYTFHAHKFRRLLPSTFSHFAMLSNSSRHHQKHFHLSPPSFVPSAPPVSPPCRSEFQWNLSQEDKDDSTIHGELSLSLRKKIILATDLLLMYTFCISVYMQLMNLLISFQLKVLRYHMLYY